MESLAVYKAISNVTAELSKEGIGKTNKNQQQGYQFRGIDDVFNSLSPLVSANHLCILPRCLKRTVVEKTTGNGKPLFYVVVKVEFDFVSAIDGSKHTVVTYGEAMDMADKATNKAMSAAYKYACLQTFCIPTEGDNDADSTTHDLSAKQQAKNVEQNKKQVVQTITPEQARELMGLLEATETPLQGLLDHYEIKNLSELSVNHFEQIKKMLFKRLQKINESQNSNTGENHVSQ